MNSATLSLWLLMSQIILPPDMNRDKRLLQLKGHFSPQIGQTVTVDPFEKNNARDKDPLDLRGFVDVKPPEGQCFLIRKKVVAPDLLICKPTRIAYTLNELTLAGTIEWTLYVDDRDLGTALIWPTPYRLAQIMPTTQELRYGHYTPIEDCFVSKVKGERKMTLSLMNGTKIHIQFPETDKLVSPQPDPEPNLYFNTKRKHGLSIDQSKVAASKKAAEGKKEGKGGDKKKDKNKEKQPGAVEGEEEGEGEEGVSEADAAKAAQEATKASEAEAKASGDMRNSSLWTRKEQKKLASQWILTARNAYEMNAGLISSDGGPHGFQGKCRYRLKNAPEDATSGIIECMPMDIYSHFIAHLSCASQLPPSKK